MTRGNGKGGSPFCVSSSPFPLGHQSTLPLGNRCFVGVLGIQVVIEKQLKSLDRLGRMGIEEN